VRKVNRKERNNRCSRKKKALSYSEKEDIVSCRAKNEGESLQSWGLCYSLGLGEEGKKRSPSTHSVRKEIFNNTKRDSQYLGDILLGQVGEKEGGRGAIHFG